MPTDGLDGFLGRLVLWLAFPVVLWAFGFLTQDERGMVRSLLDPAALRSRLGEMRRAPGVREEEAAETSHGGAVPETFEQASRDSDRTF
jgi:hypothetical protein